MQSTDRVKLKIIRKENNFQLIISILNPEENDAGPIKCIAKIWDEIFEKNSVLVLQGKFIF